MTLGSDCFQNESWSKEQDNNEKQFGFQYSSLRLIQPRLRRFLQSILLMCYCYGTSTKLQLPCVFLLSSQYPTVRLLSLCGVVLIIHQQREYPEPKLSDYATAVLLWSATLPLVRPLNCLVRQMEGWWYPGSVSSDTRSADIELISYFVIWRWLIMQFIPMSGDGRRSKAVWLDEVLIMRLGNAQSRYIPFILLQMFVVSN